MSAGLLLQYLIIAGLVVLSVWVVMHKQFPNATRRLRITCAVPLLREGCPAWLQALGRLIAPPAQRQSRACGGCDGCDPPA